MNYESRFDKEVVADRKRLKKQQATRERRERIRDAAPALLAAVRRAKTYIRFMDDDDDYSNSVITQIDRAIAKTRKPTKRSK